ncbi:unnamed protein product, partial [Ectocarpus sp. 12 AP-2014]
ANCAFLPQQEEKMTHQPNEAAAASPAPSASLLVTRDFRCISKAWEDVEPCEQPLH